MHHSYIRKMFYCKTNKNKFKCGNKHVCLIHTKYVTACNVYNFIVFQTTVT